jgi:hypothetical protein
MSSSEPAEEWYMSVAGVMKCEAGVSASLRRAEFRDMGGWV